MYGWLFGIKECFQHSFSYIEKNLRRVQSISPVTDRQKRTLTPGAAFTNFCGGHLPCNATVIGLFPPHNLKANDIEGFKERKKKKNEMWDLHFLIFLLC